MFLCVITRLPFVHVVQDVIIIMGNNKRPRGLGALLGHLPDWNKLGLNAYQACSY